MAGGADEIKLFTFNRNIFKNIGIPPPESDTTNSKKWFFIFCQAQLFVLSAAFLVFEESSMIEFGLAFFTCTTVALCFTAYLIQIWQMQNILNHIENCKQFIEKSE